MDFLEEGIRILFAELPFAWRSESPLLLDLAVKGADYTGGFYAEIKFRGGNWLLVRLSFKAMDNIYSETNKSWLENKWHILIEVLNLWRKFVAAGNVNLVNFSI